MQYPTHFLTTGLGLIAGLAMACPALAAESTLLTEKSEQANFALELLADGLDFAWDVEFLPNGDLLLSEYDGRLRLLPHGRVEGQRIIRAISDVTESGGLRSISAHPHFSSNGELYFCYATGTMDANRTRIARGHFDGRRVSATETIFEADNLSEGLLHYGCRLVWLPDGTLIATMGDRFHHLDKAQQMHNHYGVVIRINDDGSVPEDNPFLDTDDARPEIWAYGVRNVQGAAFHP